MADYNTPLPQGATIDQPQGGNDYNTPLPSGASVSNVPIEGSNAPQSDELQSNPEDSLLTKAGKAVGGTLEGVGEGVFGTLAGASDIGDKVTGQQPGGISKELHMLAGDNEQHGTAQDVGRSVETIGEFLLGDEALKGLSVADRLTKVSKIMKYIEQSPKLAQTLRLGINVGKAGTELSPEERALLKEHPVLARLASAGLDAVRHGATQAAQTTVKSGGDVKQGLEEGATMGATSAATGGALGAAGGLLSKGGEAANTVEGLNSAAQNAPTATEANDTLNRVLEGSEANQKLAGASDVAENAATNAPTNQAIASKAQKSAQEAYKALGDQFEKGRDTLINATTGLSQEYNDSHPLYVAAQDLADKGDTESKALDEAFSKGRPASEKVNERIDKLLDPHGFNDEIDSLNEEKDKQTDALETAKTPEAKEKINASIKAADDRLAEIEAYKKDNPINVDMPELLDRRKQVNEMLRKTGWATDEQRADRDAYHRIIDGIDDSIEQLVNKSGKPEAMQTLQNMNANYKAGITRFKNPDVQAILKGDSENRIVNLLSGGKSVGDIQTIKQAIGKPAFSQLADDAAQRIAADSVDKTTGKFDFNTFFKNWNKIPTDVRGEMFEGSLKGGALENALSQIKDVNSTGASEVLKPLLEKGDVSSLVKNPEQVRELANVVGPDAMSEIGKTVLQNQLRESATDATGKVTNVNPSKVLQFVESLKDSPEVVQNLFKPTPESTEAYDKLIKDLQNVQSVKNAVKYGVLAPAGLAAGAGAGSLLGHGIIGAMIAGNGELAGRQLLDRIANSPQSWRTLKALGQAANSSTAALGSSVVRAATGKSVNHLRNIYQQTKSQLSVQ